MTLAPGSLFGAYEVVSALGVGGMGEVYRAKDIKLGREVALKILSPAFTTDRDRLARLHREAKTLASLNHPKIGGIYGLEEANGITGLVMELVEGEDLSRRIARGPIPLEDALPIAKQIAEALEAAHEQRIVHRDLKPANIKLRPDGDVKVLDFGLAMVMEPVGEALHLSPAATITSPTMTQAGIILGTAAYMSPEQARGTRVDRRTDIWAFGVVLFEMLTGRRPFDEADVSSPLAAVLTREPDWRTLPASTPLGVRRLLTRCLKKDPRSRMRDIGDARLQIEELLSGAPDEVGVPAVVDSRSLWQRALPWVSIGALGAAVAVVLLFSVPWRQAPPAVPLRLSAELGGDVSLTIGRADAISLSPDGTVVAVVGQEGGAGSPQLYVRRLTQLHPTALPGTDDAENPFFSPDGEWIGFYAGGKLKKIAVTGGAAVILCDATGRGGAWGENGTIVFSPDGAPASRLMRVSADGGTPQPLTTTQPGGNVSHRWPQVLPGGRAILFTSGVAGDYNDASLVVQALPMGEPTVVQRGGYHGRYLPSGHLVYVHDGTLFAAPFDLDRLAVTGPPVPALESVTSSESSGSAQFSVSASGSIVYLPGPSTDGGRPIHWMDHEGKPTPLRAAPANWVNILFAPDGQRLAVQITEGQNDIWVYEWARDRFTRLTFNPGRDEKPVWSHDGRRIVYASARADHTSVMNLYWQTADGSGDTQRLTTSPRSQQPASWHPSGSFLAFEELNPTTNSDLMLLPMDGDEASGWRPGAPTVFLNSSAQEREPMFSPDGRWVAYSSDESGHDEVYVLPFPGPGGKTLISTGGGLFPIWSRTEPVLFYAAPSRQIMVASYTSNDHAFSAEKPQVWSETRFLMFGPFTRTFDLHPEGNRVALALAPAQAAGIKHDKVVFLFNFFDELRRIAPVTKR